MATTFQLQVSTDNTFATTVYDQSGLTSDTQSVTGLLFDTLYYWRVRTTDDEGTSDWSSTFSFTSSSPTRSFDLHAAFTLRATDPLFFGFEGTNGTYRTVRSGNNLCVSRRESNVFVDKLCIGPTGITVDAISATTGTIGTITVTGLSGGTATMTNVYATLGALTSLSATTATITNISAITATITSISGGTSTMTNIYATLGTITSLYATTATITSLSAGTATMTSLSGGTATMTNLSAGTGTITSIYGGTATLTSLSAGTATIGSVNPNMRISPVVYDDWRWGGQGVNPPGTVSPATLANINSSGVYAYEYDNGNAMAFHDLQLPHDYKEGTACIPHVHFAPSTTATYTGTWTLTAVGWPSVVTGTTISSVYVSTASFNSAMTAFQMQTIDFADVLSGVGRKISSCLHAKLVLGLTAGKSCFLAGLDAHYQKDSFGSVQITSKD